MTRRVTYQDDSLPHQIRINLVAQNIAVSCNCLRKTERTRRRVMDPVVPSFRPLEVRAKWEAGEALAVYRQHLAQAGVA